MKSPQLKQFGELTEDDFRDHAVWVGCHTADYDEPWYDETDEETFRPWADRLPVDPSDGIFLVRASMVLPDGSTLPGFVTPALETGDLGTLQPQVFVSGRRFGFWGGMFGVAKEERESFYRLAGKSPEELFPVRFQAEAGLAAGQCSGTVEGFCKSPDLRTVEVEW